MTLSCAAGTYPQRNPPPWKLQEEKLWQKCNRRSVRRSHFVINASLAGVYESCKRRGAGKVYGMLHGVAGLLERRTCVLDEKLKTALDIELLKRTPSSYLGSCRYKLPDWHTPRARPSTSSCSRS